MNGIDKSDIIGYPSLYIQSGGARCSVHIQHRMLRLRRLKDWLASFFSSRENGYTLLGRLEGHSGPVNCISFGRDGMLVASGGKVFTQMDVTYAITRLPSRRRDCAPMGC